MSRQWVQADLIKLIIWIHREFIDVLLGLQLMTYLFFYNFLILVLFLFAPIWTSYSAPYNKFIPLLPATMWGLKFNIRPQLYTYIYICIYFLWSMLGELYACICLCIEIYAFRRVSLFYIPLQFKFIIQTFFL